MVLLRFEGTWKGGGLCSRHSSAARAETAVRPRWAQGPWTGASRAWWEGAWLEPSVAAAPWGVTVGAPMTGRPASRLAAPVSGHTAVPEPSHAALKQRLRRATCALGTGRRAGRGSFRGARCSGALSAHSPFPGSSAGLRAESAGRPFLPSAPLSLILHGRRPEHPCGSHPP